MASHGDPKSARKPKTCHFVNLSGHIKSDFLDIVCIENRDLCVANTKTEYIDIYYMLQRQNLYVIKTNLYVIKTKFICYKDKVYMLYRQNLYVAKTKSICCKDKQARC